MVCFLSLRGSGTCSVRQSCVVHEYNSGIFIAGNWIWSNPAYIQGSGVCIRTDRDSKSCLGGGGEGKQGKFLHMKGKLGICTAYTLIPSMLWSFSFVRSPVVLLCRTVGNACYFMNRQLLNLIVILAKIRGHFKSFFSLYPRYVFLWWRYTMLYTLTKFSQWCKKLINTKASSEVPVKATYQIVAGDFKYLLYLQL